MSACEAGPCLDSLYWEHLPYGPMSLLDMINFGFIGIYGSLQQLRTMEVNRERMIEALGGWAEYEKRPRPVWATLDPSSIDWISGHLDYITKVADQLELQAVHDRISIFRNKLRIPMIADSCSD